MRYDFALHYFPSLTRNDEIRYDHFDILAKAVDRPEVKLAADWRNDKFKIVNKSPLWKKRRVIVYREYPAITLEVYTSRRSSVTYYLSGTFTLTPARAC